MFFNSYEFILLFLPLTWCMYFLFNRYIPQLAHMSLIVASLVFYALFDVFTLAPLLLSLGVNYFFCFIIARRATQESNTSKHRILLLLPVIFNIGLLVYFKYTNFLIGNINAILGSNFALSEIVLPLGISFFTFQQIAYLASVMRGEIDRVNLVEYLTYILYFPKLTMGPLADPVDFISQLRDTSLRIPQWENIASGVKLFSFGLFKKVIVADTFAKAVSWGFANQADITSVDCLLVMLFYTLQIYFDFSGYCDMAIGVSEMFNIKLPLNFNSPYKALSVEDFWKRWHMSLTGFFRKYVYIPLGGNRKGDVRTAINIMIIFLISGVWHGANWTFILWGAIYGVLMVVDRFGRHVLQRIPRLIRWMSTFVIVNVLWLLFRSNSVQEWASLLGKIVGLENMTISPGLMEAFSGGLFQLVTHVFSAFNFDSPHMSLLWMLGFTLVSLAICLAFKNAYATRANLSKTSLVLSISAFIWAVLSLGQESIFIYNNF